MKKEVTLTPGPEAHTFSPGIMMHTAKFLCDAYEKNKAEWDKQKVTTLDAVRMALTAKMFFEDKENKLFEKE